MRLCTECKLLVLTGKVRSNVGLCPDCGDSVARAIYAQLREAADRQPVVSLRCHPSRRAWAERHFDGLMEFDESCEPDLVEVIPVGYAKNITTTIGFTNPEKA